MKRVPFSNGPARLGQRELWISCLLTIVSLAFSLNGNAQDWHREQVRAQSRRVSAAAIGEGFGVALDLKSAECNLCGEGVNRANFAQAWKGISVPKAADLRGPFLILSRGEDADDDDFDLDSADLEVGIVGGVISRQPCIYRAPPRGRHELDGRYILNSRVGEKAASRCPPGRVSVPHSPLLLQHESFGLRTPTTYQDVGAPASFRKGVGRVAFCVHQGLRDSSTYPPATTSPQFDSRRLVSNDGFGLTYRSADHATI